MRRGLWILAASLGLSALAGGAVVTGIARYNAPGPLTTARAVVVPRGTPGMVAESLLQAGVIDNPLTLRLAAFVTQHSGILHAGEFAFPDHASLFAVLTILRNGRVVQHRLTIPEGLTTAQIASLFDKATALEGDATVPAEGGILPETYSYVLGTTRNALMERATTAMDRALSQAWESRSPNLPLTSPRDLLIVASIVERETAKPEERAHVAAVFLNRLRRGMKLQSDPTTAYAVSGGMTTFDRGLTRADLEVANPYNTYFTPALPPGPIVSPGVASLQAVAQPMVSDDLYFVADGNGGHLFAKTLEAHNKNVALWRALHGR